MAPSCLGGRCTATIGCRISACVNAVPLMELACCLHVRCSSTAAHVDQQSPLRGGERSACWAKLRQSKDLWPQTGRILLLVVYLIALQLVAAVLLD
jgi:hypothetical protein